MNNLPLIAITGASSGIGAAMAIAFSAAGHPLLLLSRNTAEMEAMELPDTLCKAVDVTDREAVIAAVAEAEAQFGAVDCFINNAGMMLLGDMHTQSPAEWQQMFDVNVMGLLNGIHSVLPAMRERKGGTIINVSSIAGKKTFPNHVAYCGTKFAVHAMSENLREEVADDSVRVITIAPGAVETNLLSHTTSDAIKAGYEEWKESMGGVISADDIARSTLFVYQQPQNVCIRELVVAATRQQP
ncbi:MAG: SDR family oxidoreductase [Amphritea sp.]|nr:SDR family oxidoreductase [Amphritea sp.]